jgi:hypothetical protein
MRNKRVCPVARAGSLDNRLRRLLQNPGKILRPFVNLLALLQRVPKVIAIPSPIQYS